MIGLQQAATGLTRTDIDVHRTWPGCLGVFNRCLKINLPTEMTTQASPDLLGIRQCTGWISGQSNRTPSGRSMQRRLFQNFSKGISCRLEADVVISHGEIEAHRLNALLLEQVLQYRQLCHRACHHTLIGGISVCEHEI